MAFQIPQGRLLICTHNHGKLREIEAILSGADGILTLVSPAQIGDLPEPSEDGDTFLANAQIKARAAFRHTRVPSLADDSGLVVPALDGWPGVYSARYGLLDGHTVPIDSTLSWPNEMTPAMREQQNRRRLLRELAARPDASREAYFVCVMVLCMDESQEVSFEGRCEGTILHSERGSHGFGYDPLFFVEAYQQTFAQLEPAIKNQISHRACALAALRAWLLGTPTK